MIGELLLHVLGDYVTQSDWMAQEKRRAWTPAAVHAVVYTVPFVLLTQSIPALLTMCLTHAVIDHYRLARYVVWVKNFLGPRKFWPRPWGQCTHTGYNPDVPPYMSVWLMIIVDNLMHVTINAGALRWL